MALNFSHRPIFPAHISEDNFVSPMRIVNGCLVEGIPERNGDGFVKSRCVNQEMDDCFDYGRDRVDRCGSPESASKDIIDLLPSDPFGMDISTTFTAITGWLEDLEVDYEPSNEEYGLFAGLNLIWKNALKFQSFPENMRFDDRSSTVHLVDRYIEEGKLSNAFSQCGFQSVQNVEDILGFDSGIPNAVVQKTVECQETSVGCSDGDGGAPHEALFFALSYVGVRDLLSVERVCKSLHSAVQNDPLLWRSVHIDQPLNEKITDDVLLQLTSRAQGNLQSLSLVKCPRITDDGLKCVLQSNPRLTKLCVPGCTKLSIEGIVNGLKSFNSINSSPGIKNLRIGGLYGITQEHFEELKFLLGTDSVMQQNDRKPHFYHRGNLYLLCDDDRAIDVEICPRCQKLRLVYDCPAEGCQVSDHGTQACRACALCVARCIQCGRCINDSEYEETFCLELLCSDCMKHLTKWQEKQERRAGSSKNVVHPVVTYKSCLHG